MSQIGKIRVRVQGVNQCHLDGETVVLLPGSNETFYFNKSGSVIWNLLEKPRRQTDLIQAFSEQFDLDPGECADRINLLFEDLEDLNLVNQSHQAVPVESAKDLTEWEWPWISELG